MSTFEGGVRVPTILWGPDRVPAGTTCDRIASTLDVLPTLTALAGAKPPDDRVIDGEDIRHLFHGDFDQADPDKAFFYYLRGHLQAVRRGQWKLHLPRAQEPIGAAPFSRNNHIAPQDRIGFDKPFLVDLEQIALQCGRGKRPLLGVGGGATSQVPNTVMKFALSNDIGEATNVADQHPDIARRLLALAEEMREDLGDYDRVGRNMRFFDLKGERPLKPLVPAPRKPAPKPKR